MRLIDADALLTSVYRKYGPIDALEDIRNAPTVDAEPVIHAKWVHIGDGFILCTNCYDCVYNDDIYWDSLSQDIKNLSKYNLDLFCPTCGAIMDEEEHTDEAD